MINRYKRKMEYENYLSKLPPVGKKRNELAFQRIF